MRLQQGTILRMRGFPFVSQDTEITVCAQSALWMVARYFSNRYRSYPEIYPFQIGELTRDYPVGRLFPTGRLYVWQMAEVLRRINYSPLI